MAKAITGYDRLDVPDDLMALIRDNPLFKVSHALSEYGFMDHKVVTRLESIDSLNREEAEVEYKKFLSEVEELFESKDEDTDEFYL